MLKPIKLNDDLPRPVKLLLQTAVNSMKQEKDKDLHPEVFEATDPDDIYQRRQLDDIGLRVFRDNTNGRHYLVGLGVHDRQTRMSGMGFEKKPIRALIIYCPIKDDQIRLWEGIVAQTRGGKR